MGSGAHVFTIATIATVATIALPREAHASPQARLVYSRGAGAEGCADESALRRAVAARIGYDPFFPWAPKTVVAMISAKGDRLVARVELVGDESRSEGARELESEGSDCAPLIDTIALSISIAIDPHALAGPAPAPPPPPPPPAAEKPEPERALPPAAVDPSPNEKPIAPAKRAPILLAVDGRVAFGAEPSAAPGIGIGAAIAWPAATLAIEGAAHLPTDADAAGGGKVRGWLAAASIVPCLRLAAARVCALGSVGRFEGSGSGVASPETHAAPYVALGGRAGIEVPLAASFVALAHADLLFNVDPATLQVGTIDVWTAPRVSGALAFGAGTYF